MATLEHKQLQAMFPQFVTAHPIAAPSLISTYANDELLIIKCVEVYN